MHHHASSVFEIFQAAANVHSTAAGSRVLFGKQFLLSCQQGDRRRQRCVRSRLLFRIGWGTLLRHCKDKAGAHIAVHRIVGCCKCHSNRIQAQPEAIRPEHAAALTLGGSLLWPQSMERLQLVSWEGRRVDFVIDIVYYFDLYILGIAT